MRNETNYNYETWNVALWRGNDGTDGNAQALDALNETDGDRDEAVRLLADRIKAEHDELRPDASGTFADLLSSALSQVDWRAIAAHDVDDALDEWTADHAPDEDEDEVATA